jgi:anti-anti-sigma factor
MVESLTAPISEWDVEPVLEMWVHEDVQPPVVTLAGQLDAATGIQVRALLARLLEEGHPDVVVDLHLVDSVHEEVVGVLVGSNHIASPKAGQVVLVRQCSSG